MRRLRDHALTLAELLTEHSRGYTPAAARRPVLTQVHWHQHAVLGWDADEKLLAAADAQAEHLETGCCGLAGNFGFQDSAASPRRQRPWPSGVGPGERQAMGRRAVQDFEAGAWLGAESLAMGCLPECAGMWRCSAAARSTPVRAAWRS